jgi:hypothetical protein
MPRRKKAHSLTTEQVLKRLFPKPVQKALKHVAEHSEVGQNPLKPKSRKAMKRG